MKEIIIHIGGGKCGSSSLQRLLTYNCEFRARDGRTVSYYRVDRNGTVFNPGQIRLSLGNRPVYRATAMPRDEEDFARLESAIIDIIGRDDESVVPVISNEAFSQIRGLSYFEKSRIFDLKDVRFTILYFVRPQVEWFSSAWWQWGVWSGGSLESFIDEKSERVLWYENARRWRSLSENVDVHVMDVGNDVIGQFFDVAGIDGSHYGSFDRANTTSPQALLDFFLRTREFRTGYQDSRFELFINQLVPFRGKRARFVLSPELQDLVFDRFADSNRNLVSLIPERYRQDFAADGRWFERGYYHDRYEPAPGEADIVDGDLFTSDLLRTIEKLHDELIARDMQMDSLRRSRGWRLAEALASLQRRAKRARAWLGASQRV